ncbi:hypothetical protein B0H16DRAFT_1457622 [Mycena metata]|uniref:Uncharacterized protein n=1 Tax=Mycena metata TaxID=1033252 RepID=A0AAD7J6X8_9AGAR|nr:hypothetical protein B0H16DRAFT_1457622 [Mycena metata]
MSAMQAENANNCRALILWTPPFPPISQLVDGGESAAASAAEADDSNMPVLVSMAESDKEDDLPDVILDEEFRRPIAGIPVLSIDGFYRLPRRSAAPARQLHKEPPKLWDADLQCGKAPDPAFLNYPKLVDSATADLLTISYDRACAWCPSITVQGKCPHAFHASDQEIVRAKL